MNTYLDGPKVQSRSFLRFLVFGIAVILGSSILSVRLFALQVGSDGHFATLAQSNRTVQQPITSTRGLIYDRNGVPLVTNVASYSVRIRPADLPESRRQAVVEMLAKLVGADPTDINVAIATARTVSRK